VAPPGTRLAPTDPESPTCGGEPRRRDRSPGRRGAGSGGQQRAGQPLGPELVVRADRPGLTGKSCNINPGVRTTREDEPGQRRRRTWLSRRGRRCRWKNRLHRGHRRRHRQGHARGRRHPRRVARRPAGVAAPRRLDAAGGAPGPAVPGRPAPRPAPPPSPGGQGGQRVPKARSRLPCAGHGCRLRPPRVKAVPPAAIGLGGSPARRGQPHAVTGCRHRRGRKATGRN
jgi:hypothetical protein